MQLTLTAISYLGRKPPAMLSHDFDEAGGAVGRSANSDFCIPDPGRRISSLHALIEFKNNSFQITNLSAKGMFVNHADRPLGPNRSVILREGDVIRIGDYLFAVSLHRDQPRRQRSARMRPAPAAADPWQGSPPATRRIPEVPPKGTGKNNDNPWCERRVSDDGCPSRRDAADKDALQHVPPDERAGAKQSPPASRKSLRQAVNQELVRLFSEHMEFRCPVPLKVGSAVRVALMVSTLPRSLTVEATDSEQVEHPPWRLSLSPVIKVNLAARSVDIKPMSKAQKVLREDGPVEWSWRVIPRRAGLKTVHLWVTVTVLVNGKDEIVDNLVIDRELRIDPDFFYTVRRFFGRYWKWAVGGAAVPVLVWFLHQNTFWAVSADTLNTEKYVQDYFEERRR